MKAHQGFAQFQGSTEPEFAAWLRRILVRIVIDHVRYAKTAKRDIDRQRSLEEFLDHSSHVIERFAVPQSSSPSQNAQQREMSVLLANALEQLSSIHREVIVLRNLEELDWADVAKKMGRGVDATRMLWTRALRNLRPLIENLR